MTVQIIGRPGVVDLSCDLAELMIRDGLACLPSDVLLSADPDERAEQIDALARGVEIV